MDGLGARIRQRRLACKLGLQTVADRTGLTASFLSQVERDLASPSLTSLSLIVKAIGVDIREVLPPPEVENGASHPAGRPRFGPNPEQLSYERLSASLPGGMLHALMLHAAPGYGSEVSTHAGEEFVYVLEGQIRYVVGGRIHDLGPTESLHFSSLTPHHVENVGSVPARYLSLGTFDLFGGPPQHAGGGPRKP